MASDGLVFSVAASYVRRLGPAAVAALSEQAEIAAERGDFDGARIWREIADAADEMVKPTAVAS